MRPLVILPTYNEAQNVPEVLERLRRAVPEADVLVVDDSSPDGTADLAEEAGAHVLRRPGKAGLGPAYVAGFHWALERGYDVVVQMDADLSHDPAVVPSLLAAVESGADFAVGARYIPGGSIPDWPWYRRALSRWGNRYARFMLRLPGHDATSGFRAVRAGLLKEAGVTALQADGYGFLIEELYSFRQVGAGGVEVPIVFRDRTRGASKMSGRIIVEALVLVTAWGMRDWARARMDRRRRHRRGA